jgi:hypothetical protein
MEEISIMVSEARHFHWLSWGGISRFAALAVLTAGMAGFPAPAAAQQAGQKTFPSAIEASKALVGALQANDPAALMDILGRDAKDIISSGDEVEDKNNREDFLQKYQQMHRLVTEPDGTTTLYIGAENWPTPIPLAEKGGVWYFDTPAGKEEILYRRIGRNELAVIQVCRELVDAEKEYYAQPHDGASGQQYAQKIFSDPDKHNGLYWQSAPGETESPIGPLLASAEAKGYPQNSNHSAQPFLGYHFRLLSGQGAHVPGGAHSYVVDGKMTEGFAFLAYPADYRSSGVMTFIVDEDGIVYQKDLGSRTAEIAKTLTRYDRDATWHKAD